MAKRQKVVEIYAPTEGLKFDAPSTLLPLRAMPEGGINGKMYYGVNQKEFGTSLYSTATVGLPVSAIFDANFPGGDTLQLFTNTGVYRHSNSADTLVVDGQTFTGTQSDYWSGVMHNDKFVYSNGKDPIQVKPSLASTGTSMASALSPTTYKSYVVASYRDHLNLYRTIENGTDYYKRVRWTKKGVLSYSAGTTDFESGTAGAIDIQEAEGEIQTVIPLGVVMAIYCERCILIQTWVGGDEIYKFVKTVSGVGTPSRRGAVSHGDVNYFISRNNFHAYYGGADLRNIGDPIRKQAFGEINQDELRSAFVEYNEQDEEVLFHVPTGTSTSPDTVWVYRLDNQSWSKLDRSFTSVGESTRFNATTIGDLQGTIGDQTMTFGDYYVQQGAATTVYGDASGRLTKKDNSVYSMVISGTTTGQAFAYVTPDIVGINAKGGKVGDSYDSDEVDYTTWKKRFLKLTFEATGNGSANVYYSVDKGSTYTEFTGSPVTLSPSGTVHELDVDYSDQQMRFKIVNTGTYNPCGVSYVKVTMTPQSTV